MSIRQVAFSVFALCSIAVTGVALAQNQNVIDQRQKLFKEIDVGADDMEDMLRGKKSFDLAYVQKSLALWVDHSAKLPALFPEDSRTGKTRAQPRVWQERARFDALLDTFAKDSAAAAATVKDEASFKAAMPKLFGDCKSCHDDFRAKRR